MTAQTTDSQTDSVRRLRPEQRLRLALNGVRNNGIVVGAVLLGVALTIASPQFLTGVNAANLLDQWSPVAVIAAGMTLLFISGGFDISAGATFALAGIVAAQLANSGHVLLGILVGIAIGITVGAANGLLVTVGRINSFVATLATSFIVGGVALAASHGLLVSVTDPGFAKLGQGTFLGLTFGVYLALVVLAVAGFVLHRTILGRRMFAVGGNAEAALLSGVRVHGMLALNFIVVGGLAGLAGVLQASRVTTADPNAGGLPLVFEVFASVIVGGTSLLGGEGAMWRTVVGLAVLAMISNAFVLINLSAVYQQVFFGVILLLAVAVDAWGRTRESRG